MLAPQVTAHSPSSSLEHMGSRLERYAVKHCLTGLGKQEGLSYLVPTQVLTVRWLVCARLAGDEAPPVTWGFEGESSSSLDLAGPVGHLQGHRADISQGSDCLACHNRNCWCREGHLVPSSAPTCSLCKSKDKGKGAGGRSRLEVLILPLNPVMQLLCPPCLSCCGCARCTLT